MRRGGENKLMYVWTNTRTFFHHKCRRCFHLLLAEILVLRSSVKGPLFHYNLVPLLASFGFKCVH